MEVSSRNYENILSFSESFHLIYSGNLFNNSKILKLFPHINKTKTNVTFESIKKFLYSHNVNPNYLRCWRINVDVTALFRCSRRGKLIRTD